MLLKGIFMKINIKLSGCSGHNKVFKHLKLKYYETH